MYKHKLQKTADHLTTNQILINPNSWLGVFKTPKPKYTSKTSEKLFTWCFLVFKAAHSNKLLPGNHLKQVASSQCIFFSVVNSRWVPFKVTFVTCHHLVKFVLLHFCFSGWKNILHFTAFNYIKLTTLFNILNSSTRVWTVFLTSCLKYFWSN